MKRRLWLTAFILFVAMVASGCVMKVAMAQTEPAPEAKSTEAQTEPKQEMEKGSEHGEAATEGKKEGGGEDAEAALKESAMVKKFGSLLGIKNPATAYWVFTIINFGILALALGGAMKRLLPGMFRSRSTSIQKSIEDARKASAEASRRLTDIEGRLGRLDAEISSLRASAEQQAKAEEERLRASTEEEKRKIIQAAEQEIASASAAAQRDLKQFVAQLAISLAEKNINVNESADRTLVREFTEKIGNGAGRGRA